MVKTFQAYLPPSNRTYSCVHCRAHLASHDELISKVSFFFFIYLLSNKYNIYFFIIFLLFGVSMGRNLRLASQLILNFFFYMLYSFYYGKKSTCNSFPMSKYSSNIQKKNIPCFITALTIGF